MDQSVGIKRPAGVLGGNVGTQAEVSLDKAVREVLPGLDTAEWRSVPH